VENGRIFLNSKFLEKVLLLKNKKYSQKKFNLSPLALS
jgi:hypothetical protein